MEAILSFNLDDHDDREAHLRCTKALNLCLVLFDLDNELRSSIKHSTEEDTEERIKALEDVRNSLNGLMIDHNIDLEELMS